MHTKPITDIEAGQRYSDYHLSDPDGEVFTFVSTEPTRDPGFLWLTYKDADGEQHRVNVPVRMAVWPVGPAPSVVKTATAQLQRELSHPAFAAAVAKIMDEDA